MSNSLETEVECPYCGEMITLLIDPSEESQTYVEDCSVCCKPIQIHARCEEGELTLVEALRQ